jgi:hypothetical protein
MWHWQEAVKAVFAGKVTVVDVYPGVSIRATNLEIPLPSVIALIDYVQQPNSVRICKESFSCNNSNIKSNSCTTETCLYKAECLSS